VRAELLHPDGTSALRANELGAELLERVRPAAEALGGADALDRIDPSRSEGELQLRSTSPHDVAADLVLRSVA
jgi:hypothetical protein